MRKWVVTLALLLCVVLPNSALAQVNAILSGTVSDSSGALIPGVEVTAKNITTGIADTRLTNETGSFVFPSLQPGSYTLSAARAGFQTATYNAVSLGQGQQVRLNFTLQVGAAAQNVEVTIAADTLIATTSASVGNVLTIKDLPLASRNVLDLVSTTPGVVTTINAFGAPVYNFGGTPISQVNTTRDGLTTNDGRYNNSNGVYSAVYTSPDMVEEVRITSSNIDPSLGRGSAQVQMRTRAGGNEFHGAVFYTNNNSKFNAQQWFSNLARAPKDYRNRNQFGGRLGGPIVQNKAFFFVLIDDQRFLEKQDFVTTVLTEPARQGIFRYLTEGSVGGTTRRNGNAFATTPSVNLVGQTLTADPFNGTPLFLNSFHLFNDVRDPNRTRIDPVWFGPQFLTRMPLPNDWSQGDGLNTAGFRWRQPHEGLDGATGQSQNTNRNHLTLRFDYQLNASNRFTFTMSREKNWGVTGQTGLPDLPTGVFGQVKRVPDFYTASCTSTISSTILNEFRFGMKRDSWQGTSPFDRDCCWSGAGQNEIDELSKEMVASYPSIGGKMMYVGNGLGLGNYAPFGVASPRQSVSPFKQFADVISFTKGAHSFSAGFEMDFTNSHGYNHGGQQTTRPNATLGVGTIPVPNINNTNFRGLNPTDVTLAQNMLASMSGTVATIQQQSFVNSPTATDWSDYRTTILFERDQHQDDWNLFFKDNWKVSKNLTLNMGLRYDKYGVAYDSFGLGGRFTGGVAGTGGQGALFGCSGKDFNALWNPNAGCDPSKLTTTEFVGKNSPNPDKLIWGNDWTNFAPSFGFSYQVPWFSRSTVIRGGYGINYAGAPDFLGYNGNIGNLPGQTLNVTYTPSTYLNLSGVPSAGVVPVPTGGAKPFAAIPFTNRAAGITGYADDRKTPYVQSFNLTFQHELARNWLVDLNWLGNKATRLYSGLQLNDTNVFENGLLDAFIVTRNGGTAPLFDRLLMNLNVTGVGVVNGTTLTGSQALRQLTTTNQFIANGDVGALANFINTTSSFTGSNGGLLRNGGFPENFIVVNPQFGSVTLQGNNENSTYHSFQSILTKRMSGGLQSQVSYTFSKALGDTGTRNQRDRSLNKGVQSIDRTNIFKINGTYDLPFGANRKFLANAPGLVQRIVEGWQFASAFQLVSGAPLSFTSALGTYSFRTTNSADLVGTLPKELGKVEKGNGFVEYFSGLARRDAPSPFAAGSVLAGRFTNQVIVDQSGNIVLQNPAPGTAGNTALNLPTVRGPGSMDMSMTMTKRIRIDESKDFTLRVDAVNVLNHPVFANPNTNINNNAFGRITNTVGTPRTITFNARVDF